MLEKSIKLLMPMAEKELKEQNLFMENQG